MKVGQDSLKVCSELDVEGTSYQYFSLPALMSQADESGKQHFADIERLPYSLKVLLENLLRHEDGQRVTRADIDALIDSIRKTENHEIAYSPVRVLMQDFTGVPAIVDLAAMRDAVTKRGEKASLVNPLNQVDLVIDHSVTVDKFGSDSAYKDNVALEMERNYERYTLLRWGQSAFDNFRVVPPGTGICHQVNLEYLAKTVWSSEEDDGQRYAYPDTLVGTDSHTTMINGLGVLGWGVGGIEAEAAMLGQPVSMLIPDVVGFKLTGALPEGVTATDLVLTVVEMLRKHGVVGKFVEFYGEGLNQLPLADRATIANMSPEFGATCGFFPVDQETLNYLQLSGRDEHQIKLVEAYAKAQGMWRDDSIEPVYKSTLELDLADVVPSLAGPIRPQDRVPLNKIKQSMAELIELNGHDQGHSIQVSSAADQSYELSDGDVVIAAITSCTNTSNPAVMMAAGLVARNAIEKGLQRKPWVKASLAPGSKVVTDYLAAAGYQTYLDELGFNLVGYGCTTCIGNSGPLPDEIEKAADEGKLTLCSVLSGNRNFEGRIHPKVRANWLASPPLVVAMALAGTMRIDLDSEPLGTNEAGEEIYLKDIWPSNHEVAEAMTLVNRQMFSDRYADVFTGDEIWRAIPVGEEETYPWNDDSTYVRNPPFFEENQAQADGASRAIKGANILALLGDSITTDHISPAGSIAEDSPAGLYLKAHGIVKHDFNSYGSRRGNHEVMMRGTFANVRIKNEMCPGVEGGYTRYIPDDEQMPIYDAAMAYQQHDTPLVVVAGKEYGTGSSRDWAAKGTLLLGVKAVIAESFERIHRSNLVGMGVLPLQFQQGDSRKSLKLDGSEVIDIDVPENLQPGDQLHLRVVYTDGRRESVKVHCRIDTEDELKYYQHGGILSFVLEQLMGNASSNADGASSSDSGSPVNAGVRIEQDSLGDVEVADTALWGAQTQRSLQNFRIGRQHFPKTFIHAYAELKRAAAVINCEQGRLDEERRNLIVTACDEIIDGRHDDQFPLVIWQTGSGTQTNMNLNEVIANRANELAGEGRGSKTPVHPNDHVNMSQSSNDSFPAAMHITTAMQVNQQLLPALDKLLTELELKGKTFERLVKSGRTHMMDATPVTLGQEFSGYRAQIQYAREQILNAMPGIYALAIGGSAVGTGLNTHPDWASTIVRQLALQTGMLFTSAENKFAALASHDAMTHLHSQLKLLATNLMKMGNDLRMMASGPRCGLNEVQLPSNEPGSSIMPGKVNPTQIEALTMVTTQVMGNDVAVGLANSQGHFELNVYKPLIMHNLYESIELLSDAMHSFTDNCLSGLEANEEQLQAYLNNSLMLVTALTPKIGYDNAAKAAKLAFEQKLSLKEAVLELQLLSAEEFDEWVNPSKMLGPKA